MNTSNWIHNVSRDAARRGIHFQVNPHRDILIQIADPCSGFITPAATFAQIHQFEFLDIEEDEPFAITADQAAELVEILRGAREENRNVVVHCHAGLCRSGAVVEVGVFMGFTDPEVARLPNQRVKQLMFDALDMSFDPNRSAFNTNSED